LEWETNLAPLSWGAADFRALPLLARVHWHKRCLALLLIDFLKEITERSNASFPQHAHFLFMNESDTPSHGDDKTNEVDPWVQSQLSAYQIVWLEKQRASIDPTDILKCALAEWVARHPDDWFGHTSVGTAMRSAMDEFITRHKQEFLE
jgi:hypothetical protein